MYCLFTSLEIAGGDSLGDCPIAAATVQHSWASVRRRGVIESIMIEEEGLPSLNLTFTEKKKKKKEGHAGRQALYKHEKYERARLFPKPRRGGIEGGCFSFDSENACRHVAHRPFPDPRMTVPSTQHIKLCALIRWG